MTVTLGSDALGPMRDKCAYVSNPPFGLKLLKTTTGQDSSGKKTIFLITLVPVQHFYQLRTRDTFMHCVGFDISYCCVIPPYNSIQAQAFRTGEGSKLPALLEPAAGSLCIIP